MAATSSCRPAVLPSCVMHPSWCLVPGAWCWVLDARSCGGGSGAVPSGGQAHGPPLRASAVVFSSRSHSSSPAPSIAVARSASASTWSPVQVSPVRTRTPPLTLVKFQTWTPSSIRSPSPTAGPLHRMQELRSSWRTVEVMFSVVSGVLGVAGAGVVHRNCEPARRGPWSRRFEARTGACHDGRPSTSVCSLKTVLSGALIDGAPVADDGVGVHALALAPEPAGLLRGSRPGGGGLGGAGAHEDADGGECGRDRHGGGPRPPRGRPPGWRRLA